ncbi:MAG: hypothetical protein IJ597_07175, partial [Synergistaceae bacterium]|nr:hypothetical protein [Synergistaceae bacterium]
RNTGLGMWGLESYQDVRNALKPMTEGSHAFSNSNMRLPLMITSNDRNNGNVTRKSTLTGKTEDEKIFCGNVLTLLYAQRETDDDSYAPILVVYQNGIIADYTASNAETFFETLMNQLNDNDFWVEYFTNGPGRSTSSNPLKYLEKYNGYKDAGETIIEAAKLTLTDDHGTDTVKKIDKLTKDNKEIIKYVSGYPVRYKFLYNRSSSKGEFYYSDFGNGEYDVSDYDIRAWGISRGAGAPFIVKKYDNESSNKQLIRLNPVSTDIIIPEGDELLYLKCVTIYAGDLLDSDGDTERNLKIKKLEGTSWPANGDPYQTGILELYAELDTRTSILSVWVLSSGGRDKMTHDKPDEWPSVAEWKEDFKYHVTYVSKGTWKLNNLPDGFKWE